MQGTAVNQLGVIIFGTELGIPWSGFLVLTSGGAPDVGRAKDFANWVI